MNRTNRFLAMVTTLACGIGLLAFGFTSTGRAAQETDAPASTLADAVRHATARFADVGEATAAGYAPMFGCVSGPQGGAMGTHYLNGSLVGDGTLDPEQPEALIYETVDGQLHFVGVEFLVLAEDWHANNEATPTLLGQLFNYVGSPNRYGNPPFYELHVWAGKDNPHGTFADWNPDVSCDGFSPAEYAS